MREPATYRLELEQIVTATGKRVLNVVEVMEYTGRSRNWCNNHLIIPKCGISAAELARQLSTLGG